MLAIIRETTSGSCLAPTYSWGSLRCRTRSMSPYTCGGAPLVARAQRLDDAPGRDVLGTTIDDVELLAALIVAGLGVRVAVDDLDRPLGVLELHLLLVVALMGNMLLAFPLVGRRAVVVLLLLLLMELLYKLLDLSALLGAVAPEVVHRALRSALIAAGGLARSLVAVWVVAPTSHCCDSDDSGSTCQRLVVVGLLLLPVLVLATALSSGICFGLAGLPCPWSGLGVPCTPFCHPGAFVR
jgi:hypothetical protein